MEAGAAQEPDPARLQWLRVFRRITLGLYAAFSTFAVVGTVIGANHGDALLGLILGLSALAGLLLVGTLVGSTMFGLSILRKTVHPRR